MNRKLTITFAALAIAACGLIACGDDDETTTPAETTPAETTTAAGGGAGGTIEIGADPDGALAYASGDLSTKAGEVTIEFDNPAPVPHDVRIENESGDDVGGTDEITESSTSATVALEPGTYTYYCSVPGHRAAGMEAALTVK